MLKGAFTESFDLPLLLVIVFSLFFLVLVLYLHRESKREGYPLVSDRTARTNGRVKVVGFPGMPKPKAFILPHGEGVVYAPKPEEPLPVPAANAGNFLGMPVNRDAVPLGTNLGPGSFTPRRDKPDVDVHNQPIFRPLRHATAFKVMKGEPDPRGFVVLGMDKCIAGTVVDIWIDAAEHMAKFLEVELAADVLDQRPADQLRAAPEMEPVGVLVTDEIVPTPAGPVEVIEAHQVVAPRHYDDGDARPAARGSILLPMNFAAVNASQRVVRCGAIKADQFAGVPGRQHDLYITAREENALRGYYGGGYLWADASRAEPML